MVVAVCALAGCGDDAPASDAGGVDASDGGASVVTPPAIDWLADGAPPIELPGFTPCPDGWHEATAGEVGYCEPYASAGRDERCDAGEAHFPGEEGCRPIGDPCPAGDYAEGLPTDGTVIYVNPSAAPGGDGSLAAPYAALSEVRWSSLSSGATVALSKGSFEGTLPLKATIRVVGACVAETLLTGVDAPVAAVINVTNAGEPAFVKNVHILDAPQNGATVISGRALVLEGVLVEGMQEAGLQLADDDSRLELRDVVVRGTVPDSAGLYGRGINTQDASTLEAQRVLVEANHDTGIFVGGPMGQANLEDVVVVDTLPQASDRRNGTGIAIGLGSVVSATRLLVADNLESGIYVVDTSSVATLTDAVIRGTRPQLRDSARGRGLNIRNEARLEAIRLVVLDNAEAGLALGAGVTTTLEDVVVYQTRASEDPRGYVSSGIQALNGAELRGSRVSIFDNQQSGLTLSDGASAEVTDLVIANTYDDGDSVNIPTGLGVQNGARLDATRARISGNQTLGVWAYGESSMVTLTDAIIDGRRPDAAASLERGVELVRGSRALLERVVVTHHDDASISLNHAGTELQLTDCVVQAAPDGGADPSISILAGAHLVAERVELFDARAFGMQIAEATADATDLRIERVGGGSAEWGHGLVVEGGGLEMSRFEIAGASGCGLMVAASETAGTSVDASEGIVRDAAIGACVQVDGYDLSRLNHDVQYVDNGSNLDATSLPLPAGPATLNDEERPAEE